MDGSLFESRKDSLKRQVLLESFHSISYEMTTDEIEKQVAEKFDKAVKEDRLIDPAVDFLDVEAGRDSIRRSEVFKMLSKAPKGALLHVHGISAGDFVELVEFLQKDPRVYVYCGEKTETLFDGEIRYLTKSEVTPEWTPAKDLPAEKILANITLHPSHARENRWPEFQDIWCRVRVLSDTMEIWDGEGSFLWKMLETTLRSGVTYLELKQVIPQNWICINKEGTESTFVDTAYFMKVFKNTVDQFKAVYPDFVHAKMIWCSLKAFDKETIKQHTEIVLSLEKEYADYIAGFDLVGHEDTLDPICKYKEELVEFKDRGGRLILHAGETLYVGDGAENLYDAIAIDCSRIGHAYALPKFPTLMRIVKERGIVVECCPISNQVLGYALDLRNHPAHIMINNGLKLCINSDDPAMFGYSDVTFDFAVVAKAWSLSLMQIKHLCRQSFRCSTLSYGAIIEAEKKFDVMWRSFIVASSK